jgi:hypothetical protein
MILSYKKKKVKKEVTVNQFNFKIGNLIMEVYTMLYLIYAKFDE